MLSNPKALMLTALVFLSRSAAHTWNEQFALIDSNGKYTGPMGYPRGYVGRTDPGFDGYSMLQLLPPLESGRTRIDSSDLLCHPAQRQPNQSPNYPRLQVAPGSNVAMKYLENGHVTLPENQPGKPPKGGTAFVFGTYAPQQDEKIATVLQWTRDGHGGDGRGRLLAANNFDDGRCHQINSGPISMQRQQTDPDPFPDQPTSISEQWCETDVTMPTDLVVGKPITIYWIWQWPTSPGAPGLPDGKDEYYTTCSDFDVVPKAPSGPISNTLVIQDPQTAAVSDFKSRPAITPTPDLRFDSIGSGNGNYRLAPSTSPVMTQTTLTAPPAPPATSPVAAFPSSFALSTIPPPPITSTQPLYTLQASPTNIVLTALVTVVATMAPSQSMLIVKGNHIVTFTNPMATMAPPAVRRGNYDDAAAIHRRRAAVHVQS